MWFQRISKKSASWQTISNKYWNLVESLEASFEAWRTDSYIKRKSV